MKIFLLLLTPLFLCAFKIHDGDTITGVSYRLAYIDAPELKQTCTVGSKSIPIGYQSRDYLKTIFTSVSDDCSIEGKDRYGRMIVNCSYNMKMISAGMAVCYDKYIKNEAVKKNCHALQKIAQKEKVGVWGCEDFIFPEEYRKSRNNR
jgi:endonuclease YncB( thermonuclease family)